MQFEQETINLFVTRGSANLVKFLKSYDGQALKRIYVTGIKNAIRNGKKNVFPPVRIVPDLVHNWTTDGKATCFLNYYCNSIIAKLARIKYRSLYCQQVFLYRILVYLHRNSCSEKENYYWNTHVYPWKLEESPPIYDCYVLGKAIIDASLDSLKDYIDSSVGINSYRQMKFNKKKAGGAMGSFHPVFS